MPGRGADGSQGSLGRRGWTCAGGTHGASLAFGRSAGTYASLLPPRWVGLDTLAESDDARTLDRCLFEGSGVPSTREPTRLWVDAPTEQRTIRGHATATAQPDRRGPSTTALAGFARVVGSPTAPERCRTASGNPPLHRPRRHPAGGYEVFSTDVDLLVDGGHQALEMREAGPGG